MDERLKIALYMHSTPTLLLVYNSNIEQVCSGPNQTGKSVEEFMSRFEDVTHTYQ
jgi:hypothetical protein